MTGLFRGIAGMVVIDWQILFLAVLAFLYRWGMNLVNFAVAALLGIPGIVALYGIGFWQVFH